MNSSKGAAGAGGFRTFRPCCRSSGLLPSSAPGFFLRLDRDPAEGRRATGRRRAEGQRGDRLGPEAWRNGIPSATATPGNRRRRRRSGSDRWIGGPERGKEAARTRRPLGGPAGSPRLPVAPRGRGGGRPGGRRLGRRGKRSGGVGRAPALPRPSRPGGLRSRGRRDRCRGHKSLLGPSLRPGTRARRVSTFRIPFLSTFGVPSTGGPGRGAAGGRGGRVGGGAEGRRGAVLFRGAGRRVGRGRGGARVREEAGRRRLRRRRGAAAAGGGGAATLQVIC